MNEHHLSFSIIPAGHPGEGRQRPSSHACPPSDLAPHPAVDECRKRRLPRAKMLRGQPAASR
jgi:hypothetical protein